MLHRGSERQGFVASRFKILAAVLQSCTSIFKPRQLLPTFEAGDVYKTFATSAFFSEPDVYNQHTGCYFHVRFRMPKVLRAVNFTAHS